MTPPAKKIRLQSKSLVSGFRITQEPQEDSEERERLVDLIEPTVRHQSLPPQLKVMSSPTSDLDGVTLLQRYVQMAREFLSFLPSPCLLLSPEDIELMGKQPVAAGGSADILKGKHDGRKVVLKAYRCYRFCDITQVVVRRDRLRQVHS